MFRMKSLKLLVVIGVSLALCSTLSLAAENGKRLYPACGVTEHTTSASSQVTSTLYSFSGRTHSLTMTCLAYEVVSVGNDHADEDYCLVEHQTEYMYALVIHAVYTTGNGVTVERNFSIRDMRGGSLAELTVAMPTLSRFSVMFTNLATDTRCNLRVRALLSYKIAGKAGAGNNAPIVVAVSPHTVYSKSADRSVLVLDHGVGQVPQSTDIVSLVDFSQGTCARPDGNVLYMDYLTAIPATVHVYGNRTQLSVRAITFHEPNTYRVCYRAQNSHVATQIGVITVYAGNPAYYDVVGGVNEKGEVLVGTETTIKFYGHDLDTRENGDEAKFVEFTKECDTGKPAGGVPLANDLEPEDNYGPNTTYSLWKSTIAEGGSYKVCYKRKAVNVWTEVPFIEDVAIADRPGESTQAPVPTPTHPSTHAECPMATETAEHPWPKFKSAKVVLTVKKLPSDFLSTLSSLLCLKRSMFTLAYLKHNSEGKQVVFLVLNCEENENAALSECSSIERLNYFASLSKKQLEDHGIESVQGSTHMLAFDEDEGSSRNVFGLILLCASILAAGGMVVFAVCRYMERRHHFVQFGLDDDDIDDMYDFNAAPRSAMRIQYDVAPQAEPTRIANSVIEIED
ncbi:putative Golgi/lysosome glycoprotein [Leishmania major strain Friedlin]|uniref:Putative Golgi/lysosome glycoprotein n=1 Tax=Leishmania major TaxID=5664 RepID=Q4QIT6_LEIMA|nr:putative Golgi/lysosome glycoprotein [Leishmania major strain Friedlin]CAG9568941.1 Golgi/lysosome_glycoprotein_1_-_putative [Leishmania major strain Friedlin]CAJ06967.1 putative Golgi/lysosome glycoprotein [Leishmania major strain Friedlin]|eukprot:XP_001680912.1 putative Golgi/lysosome glycoprotein [Leishmania major strain Friedlin]